MAPDDIPRALGRLEAKVDILLEDRGRLNELEQKVSSMRGIAAVISAGIAVIASLFSGYFIPRP